MNVKIPEALYDIAGGEAIFGPLDIHERDFSWRKYAEISLRLLKLAQLDALIGIVDTHKDIRGCGILLRDLKTWRKAATSGIDSAKARTVEHAADLIKEFIRAAPRYHLYGFDEKSGVWFPYYVEEVRYHPPENRNGYVSPPFVSINLVYWELMFKRERSVTFGSEKCMHRTARTTLSESGFVIETDELRARYEDDEAQFKELHDKVGLQLFATGVGTDDLDGNDEDTYRWGRYSGNTVKLSAGGQPSRIVIDVFRETDADANEREPNIDPYFWVNEKVLADAPSTPKSKTRDRGLHGEREDLEKEDLLEPLTPEIPTHCILATFDLKRHLRLRVHVANVTVYKYDTSLGDKLVIADDVRTLIDILVAHRVDFQDIVAGKGGGATVLSCGPPGIGKTLTAEVYSEVSERPLYSVQCSQLGTDPDDLEKELLKVFARAERWNAILLLDEADVYIRSRGNDLAQNAIVGVFLRVLEYYAGVLFLTTNRGDTVDDAVASRCIARIGYSMPNREQQAEIWKILAEVIGVPITDRLVELILERYPNESGRDIKNILKLVRMLMTAQRVEKVSMSMIAFAKTFKPTQTIIMSTITGG